MASGDLYEVHLKANCDGQNLLNVFHYLQTSGASGAETLANAFLAMVVGKIQDCVATTTTFFAILAKDKVDPTDFHAISINRVGLFTGEQMPTHDAISFTYVSNRLDARSGGKRFGVPSESSQNGGDPAGSMVGKIATLEAALEANVTDFSSNAWRPVIYGKRTGGTGYYSNPLSAVRFLGFTTQNNRKFYTSPGF